MKTLIFETNIGASPEKVWNCMLDKESYMQWTNVSWPNSYYEGEFKEGKEIQFLSTEGGGTLALINKLKEYEICYAEHIALISADGNPDKESDMAKSWVGTEEKYYFMPEGDGTRLKVEIITNPEWAEMFNDTWPNALKKLKEICEK